MMSEPQSRSAALASRERERKLLANTKIARKKIGLHQRAHLDCSTPFFEWSKAVNLKENQRQRKKESGSRPLLAGSGHLTWIRATLARILIPDPDSNPRQRIRVPVRPLHTVDF
jgi:hypothetical protein